MSAPFRRLGAALLLAGMTSTVVACGGSSSSGGGGASPTAGEDQGRLSGELWRNPEGHAAVAVQQAKEQGQADAAEAFAPLAEQPTATWFANPGNPYAEVAEVSEAAAADGELPVLVAYHVPDRDCRSYSSGGAADDDTYLSWVGSFAAALEDRPALVVLEPDAVAQAVAGCEGVTAEHRFQLLSQAVDILTRQPEVHVYLDAGNPSWITDLPVLADALRRSGVDRADGFALNVSNYQTTEDNAEFGRALSEELEKGAPEDQPAAHFVIDTSRNGAGPPPDDGAGTTDWCNPGGRRVGEAPTTDTGLPRVDALLWVKQPGDSDGTCAGGPPAGQWWPEAATELTTG